MLIMVYKRGGKTMIDEFATGAGVRRVVNVLGLASDDYAVIEGELIKSFDNKTLTEKGKTLCQD